MRKQINTNSFKDLLRSQQAGGIILIVCVVVSLIIANTDFNKSFSSILDMEAGFSTSNFHLTYSISLWINDGLMAIFFLLVGLEIKRELIEGELSTPKKASMPVFAALGGMLVPAGIYMLVNYNSPTSHGWGIPMATDIAFALAILSMLGDKVPASLKIFLAALAIVDDLGAILVIALFYTNELHTDMLFYAAAVLVLLSLMNYFGVKKIVFYIIPGIFLWYFVHHSGIHATIAGVLLAFTIPTNPEKAISPLEKLEHAISAPVNYLIMPVFALANTNIRFTKEMVAGISSPIGLGIIFGLVIGKPLGVTLFSWLSVKFKIGSMPSKAGWKHLAGLGMLAGIGFTMSIFIALLSFLEPEYQLEAKFAVLISSLVSGILGYSFLNALHKSKAKKLPAGN